MENEKSLVNMAMTELKQYGQEAKEFVKDHPVISAFLVYLVLDFLKSKRHD